MQIEKIFKDIADEELVLASGGSGGPKSLAIRRETGSFYTPPDVANSLWLNFFREMSVSLSPPSLKKFLKSSAFIDPAAGAGLFLFSLIKFLYQAGLTKQEIVSHLWFLSNDINPHATFFLRKNLETLLAFGSRSLPVRTNLKVSQGDGIEVLVKYLDRRKARGRNVFVVGNPPYAPVRNGGGITPTASIGQLNDLYAVFLYWSTTLALKRDGGVGFIIPLSLTFSRNHLGLRRFVLGSKGRKSFINFDNIPDCIFSNGKPDSLNTNRSNSQRITFLISDHRKNIPKKVVSSELLSWRKANRPQVLSARHKLWEVAPVGESLVVPKPCRSLDVVLANLANSTPHRSIRTLLRKHGRHYLSVGSVARNYIAVHKGHLNRDGVVTLCLDSRLHRDFLFALLISEPFFRYWRCMGDGFHVTRGNINLFPVCGLEGKFAQEIISLGNKVWSKRRCYEKRKKNAGRMILSFDFRGASETERISEMIASLYMSSNDEQREKPVSGNYSPSAEKNSVWSPSDPAVNPLSSDTQTSISTCRIIEKIT